MLPHPRLTKPPQWYVATQRLNAAGGSVPPSGHSARNPWGGSFTLAQLAGKFGWPSVVVSLLLLPFTAFYYWVLSANPFLRCLRLYMTVKPVLRYTFESDDPHFVKRVYYSTPTNESGIGRMRFFAPDWEGGKWYESWWGLIMVLDLVRLDEDHWQITSNWLSWTDVVVDIHFAEHRQDVVFAIRVYLSPFNLFTQAWISSTLLSGLKPLNAWLGPQGASVEVLSSASRLEP